MTLLCDHPSEARAGGRAHNAQKKRKRARGGGRAFKDGPREVVSACGQQRGGWLEKAAGWKKPLARKRLAAPPHSLSAPTLIPFFSGGQKGGSGAGEKLPAGGRERVPSTLRKALRGRGPRRRRAVRVAWGPLATRSRSSGRPQQANADWWGASILRVLAKATSPWQKKTAPWGVGVCPPALYYGNRGFCGTSPLNSEGGMAEDGWGGLGLLEFP